MKKFFIAVGLLSLSGAFAYASHIHHTPCGKEVMTVDRDFFETEEEYNDFIQELDKINCP
ncbi:MAG: hypothetical protein K2J23_03425 [Muribaculaceae bacterium]|nr:hypothetical protein [Muribaculaceae bacterium]MDE6866425.1 hypothetical protein [Muribaculaceae bacterium]